MRRINCFVKPKITGLKGSILVRAKICCKGSVTFRDLDDATTGFRAFRRGLEQLEEIRHRGVLGLNPDGSHF